MFRWTSGATREDRISNEYVRESVGVGLRIDLDGLVMLDEKRRFGSRLRTVTELSVDGRRRGTKEEMVERDGVYIIRGLLVCA